MKNRFTALLYGLILVSAIANLNADSIYKSDEYGFSVKVPDDWRIHAEMNDPDEGRMIIDWGMPKVYSELEKTEIENAVSITAYKREEIKDIEDLMEFDFKRVEDITLAKSPVESMPGVSYQILTQQNMQTYSTNAVYYYENGIGYVIAFTATIGTYDMNHPQFRDFIKTIEFFEPSENRSPGSALPFDIGDTFPDSVALNIDTCCFFPTPLYSSRLPCLHPATINGIKACYDLSGDSLGEIFALAVYDSAFISPEGLSVGQPITDALIYSKGEFIRFNIAGVHYVKLPSGWNAAYHATSNDYRPFPSSGMIEFFFKPDFGTEIESRYIEKVEGY